MFKILQTFASASVVASCLCSSAFAQEPAAQADAPSGGAAEVEVDPLDEDLLEDLDSDLLEGLDDLPDLDLKPDKGPDEKDANAEPGLTPGEEEKEQGVRVVNPLIRISEQMRKVETRLTSSDTSEKTQKIQQDILDELSMVIEQLKQQQKQQQPSSPGDPQQQSQKPQKQDGDKPSGGKPQNNASQEPSNKPSRDSSDDVRKPEDIEAENRELQLMLKEVWGHLPDRVRQQMRNARVEQLLPKYQKLIEEYYKRLAEDRAN